MTTLLEHGPIDPSATAVIIHGDQLLLVGADADGLKPGDFAHDMLPPEYQHSRPTAARLPRSRSDQADVTRRSVPAPVPTFGRATASGQALEQPVPPQSEHQRFADRRASIAIDTRTARRRRRSRLVVGTLVVAGCAVGVVASPVLRVQRVELVGLSGLNEEAVMRTMALGDHPSMLSLKTRDIEQRLTEVPLIHSAKVWKEWPNRIVVEISERSAVAAIRSNGGWLVLDQHGGVLDTRTVRPDLPLLDLGGREVDEGSKDITALLEVANAASARLRREIDVLSIEGGGVTVQMRDGELSAAGTKVRIGHADDVEAKLRALATMMDDSTAVSFEGIATLDLTVADQPALIRATTLPSVVSAVGPVTGTVPASSESGVATPDATSAGPAGSNLKQ